MARYINEVGNRYGRLLVLKRSVNKNGRTCFKCICDCGNVKNILGQSLRSGLTVSCGCYNKEKKSTKRHGMYLSKTYNTWSSMIQRCCNIKNTNYHHYGGRGIEVCKRWEKFENFLEDMGERPEGKTLDRIDNDGDYKPSNCRWATQKEQTNNCRKNIYITYKGQTLTRKQWAEKMSVSPSTLRARIEDYGWSIERALSEPINVKFHSKRNKDS